MNCKNWRNPLIVFFAIAALSSCSPDYQQQMAQAERSGVQSQTQDLGTQDQIRQGAKTMANVLEFLNAHAFIRAKVTPQQEADKAQTIADTNDVALALGAIAASQDDQSFVSSVEKMCLTTRQDEERREGAAVIGIAQSATQNRKPALGSPEAKAYALMIGTGQILESIPSRCATFAQVLANEQVREQTEKVAVAQRNAALLEAASVVLAAGVGVALTGNAAEGLALGMTATAPPAQVAGSYRPSSQTECYKTGNGFICQSQ